MESLYWAAVVILASSYWFQIWKIHVHKEVRDLSVVFYAMLTVGFSILAYAAHTEGSTLFTVKNIITAIPALIILGQIYYHRDDAWDPPEKLYMVIRWEYHMPHADYSVVKVYKCKRKANDECAKLNKENDDPVQEDDYGPMYGSVYKIWEREIDG